MADERERSPEAGKDQPATGAEAGSPDRAEPAGGASGTPQDTPVAAGGAPAGQGGQGGQEAAGTPARPKVDPEKLAAARAAAAKAAAAKAGAGAGKGGAAAGPGSAAGAAARPAARAGGHGAAARRDEPVTRRDFLHWALWGSALLWLGQFAGNFAYYFWPRKVGFFGQKINIGPVSNFPVGSVTKVDAGKFYLVHTEQGLIALYWRCTHLGCTVPWKPEERPDAGGCFCCPCHGSQFNKVGEKIGGPAPRPMDYFPIEIDAAGNVWVDTGRVQQRQAFDPSQLTPVS
ncbi:ubiquinol-cytochrome c reductase iron-sulfur subunit [Thermaerobacter subterraneus]|uniref:Rieske Fe-S protein n=1 Tax=Thermaerobacter subterraneus DSM 13965 TaxID=867903 RepID=K6QD30_9FIRM|nr:Rieske (2Fe-2S) protein [Thermaerobacter subterraneus]EKP94506.1 Rieske Fe-S protein [Thermaerobacter subterraneus DSM 13965]